MRHEIPLGANRYDRAIIGPRFRSEEEVSVVFALRPAVFPPNAA